MMNKAIFLLFCLLPFMTLTADDMDFLFEEETGSEEISETEESSEDFDSLFEGDNFTEITEENMTTGLDKLFLVSENTVIGGKINFSLKSTIIPNISEKTTPDLGGKIYLEARPEDDFKVFLKGSIDIPFNEGSAESVNFTLTEMFTDFNYKDSVYFRAGKFKINWGVGRYFSPADVLNITEIDPDDPDLEREGPVSLKTNIPLGIKDFNFYIIAPNGYDSALDTTFAASYSWLFGDIEATIGGIYRPDYAPRAMMTMTSSLGDLSWYTEKVLSYGLDEEISDRFYFSGTAGGSYSLSSEDVDTGLKLSAQYYYNGEEDSHSLMSSASVTNILGSEVNFSVNNLNDLKDFSGRVNTSLSHNLLDLFSLSAGMNYNYSGQSERTLDNPLSLEFKVGFGGGSF